MSANTWFYIGIAGFFLAGIFLLISVILFFRLHIGSVFYELSGKGVAREVEQIRRDSGVDWIVTDTKTQADAAAPLVEAYEPTEVLYTPDTPRTENGTVVLTTNTEELSKTPREAVAFSIVREDMVIHTDEEI